MDGEVRGRREINVELEWGSLMGLENLGQDVR
jgi:hypothetical protein